uniref:K Homology domain-containing protein n=1 Tax=Anopheles melas TaxID=34690 RepID=A0A182UG92_9DIPT
MPKGKRGAVAGTVTSEIHRFNFVGKLLGPKGNSLKRLQEETMCKMAVLGKGSMRDRKKEEELRLSGDPRYAHLSEDLHVEISTYTAPAEAHARIAYALAEVRRFLVPVSAKTANNSGMTHARHLANRANHSGSI